MTRLRLFITGTSPVFEARCRVIADEAAVRVYRRRSRTFAEFMAMLDADELLERAA